MEIIHAYIVKRTDGAMVNIRWEPVKSIRSALRIYRKEEFDMFMTGFYKPSNPEEFYMQPIRVTYEEVNNDVQEE